jgi:hypothetical protein
LARNDGTASSALTAWQNWIFQRPNAVGDKGALKVYGTGEKAVFDRTVAVPATAPLPNSRT